MNYLLDTNVISERIAKKPDPEVLNWVENIDQESVFLSVITILSFDIQKYPNNTG